MFQSFLNTIFGCAHQRTTFPLTPSRKGLPTGSRSAYVVCLDCGKEFSYDWKEMRVGALVQPINGPVAASAAASIHQANASIH
jgi:hypothetical protein